MSDVRTPDSMPTLPPRERMRAVFQRLSPELQTVLRGLKLLDAARVVPATRPRLAAVLVTIFNTRPDHLDRLLKELEKEAFLRGSGKSGPIEAEPAYIQDAVTYTANREPEEDFTALADTLAELKDVDALVALGTTFGTELNDDDQALLCFERALTLRPEDPIALYSKGVALHHRGEIPEAVAFYKRALERREFFPEAWHNIGFALDHLGEHDEALQAYDKALGLKPDDPKFLHNRGVVLEHLGERERALKAYDQALQRKPNFPEALVNKGLNLDRSGQFSEALAVFEQALGLKPDFTGALKGMAVTLAHRQDYQGALESLDKALGYEPDDPEAWYLKGAALGNRGERTEAREWLCRAWREQHRLPQSIVQGIAGALQTLGYRPEECEEEASPES